jgi:phage shock protein PspC (stress-responsive transcriptional regulator)
MSITEQQEQRIAQYLQEVRVRLVDAPPKARDETVNRLRSRVTRELKQLGNGTPRDQDVDRILNGCGSPGRVAATVMGMQSNGRNRLTIAVTDRRWLGVCAGMAAWLDMGPTVLRLIVFILSIALAPITITVYIGLYLFLNYSMAKDDRQRVAWWTVAGRVISTVAIAIALYWSAKLLVGFQFQVYAHFLPQSSPQLNDWYWLQLWEYRMVFWVLVTTLPVTVLSALPLEGAWDNTLKKLIQAELALYGVALCFGIASVLAGLIIAVVEEIGGTVPSIF